MVDADSSQCQGSADLVDDVKLVWSPLLSWQCMNLEVFLVMLQFLPSHVVLKRYAAVVVINSFEFFFCES